ncbi:MAG TPA: hypothetical protein VKV21_18340 [Solirubrobacteraceae bacterium]|nr:hypothetical protein [Solirubrobacteraceae bacterium]
MVAVVIPVGPGERELARLDALLAELRRHERAEETAVVIVDDGPVARAIAPAWPRAAVIRTRLRESGAPDAFSAHVAGTLEALIHVRDAGHEFALKLDTDAAVIRPFAASLRAAFADPGLGVVGSYDRTATGATRDWSIWRAQIDAADRPLALRRSGRRVRVVRRPRREREHIRDQRRAAAARAPLGAHCLGGAYAVSRSFLRSAELDWRPWTGTGLGEDVVVGLLCSAAGLRMQSLTAAGEPFALAWRGLPAPPADIAVRGHAIVHSVKARTDAEERSLRGELQSAVTAVDAGRVQSD